MLYPSFSFRSYLFMVSIISFMPLSLFLILCFEILPSSYFVLKYFTMYSFLKKFWTFFYCGKKYIQYKSYHFSHTVQWHSVCSYHCVAITTPDTYKFTFPPLFYSYIFGCTGCLLLHRLFSSCKERGLLFPVAAHGLLIVVASLVAGHGL